MRSFHIYQINTKFAVGELYDEYFGEAPSLVHALAIIATKVRSSDEFDIEYFPFDPKEAVVSPA